MDNHELIQVLKKVVYQSQYAGLLSSGVFEQSILEAVLPGIFEDEFQEVYNATCWTYPVLPYEIEHFSSLISQRILQRMNSFRT